MSGAARTALLFARTLPTLRPVQVAARLWRHARRTRPDRSPAPPLREAGRPVPGVAHEPCLIGPTRVRLLGEERELVRPADWDPPDRSRLWAYHLHYLDELRARACGERAGWQRELVARWVRENPPGRRPGWEPYPLSLRLVNLVRADLFGAELPDEARHSLAVQARWLRANLEYHLLGNHLLANAKALIFAGLRFAGREGEAWLAKGLGLFRSQLEEQVLADGGHFERSPMYHARVLEDVLDVLAGLEAAGLAPEARERLRALVPPMLRWLAALTHPDGGIALFNDAALDAAAPLAALEDYARRLGLAPPEERGEALVHLAESGYARWESADAVLLADVGEIGPSYLPGHAHADTLGFELSLHGRRVVVDSGTSLYEEGPERLRQRSTAAHNTVEVDGEDSSEVWGAFRVARRARPLEVAVERAGAGARIHAGHDGYRRLGGDVVHRRTFTLGPRSLAIEDRLTGRWRRAVARLHLHPSVRVSPDGKRLLLPEGEARLAFEGLRPRPAPATWHPRFGASLPCTRLDLELEGGRSCIRMEW